MDEADATIYDAGFHAGERKVQFQVKRLLDDNARLRATLAWYADEENYYWGAAGHEIVMSGGVTSWDKDKGQRARDALRADEKGGPDSAQQQLERGPR